MQCSKNHTKSFCQVCKHSKTVTSADLCCRLSMTKDFPKACLRKGGVPLSSCECLQCFSLGVHNWSLDFLLAEDWGPCCSWLHGLTIRQLLAQGLVSSKLTSKKALAPLQSHTQPSFCFLLLARSKDSSTVFQEGDYKLWLWREAGTSLSLYIS